MVNYIQIEEATTTTNRKGVTTMNKISVYHFAQMFFNCKEIAVHGWYKDEEGNEKCIHKTYTDRFHPELYSIWKDFEVGQFKATKKNCIDVIAFKF